jgi:hypothetical protein
MTKLALTAPTIASVRYYPAGSHCTDAAPGSVLLVRHTSFVAGGIRLAERIRRPRDCSVGAWKAYCGWNHAAVIIEGGLVSEEAGHGDQFVPLADYIAEEYAVITLSSPQDQIDNVVKFATSIKGTGYGFVTIVADLTNALTGLELSLGLAGHMVCSTATCRALERTDFIPDRDPSAVTPAHLAWYLNAPYIQPKK